MDSTLEQHLIESIYKIFENAFSVSISEMPSPLKETLIYTKIEITDDAKAKEVIIGIPKEGLTFLNTLYCGCDKDDFLDIELEDFIKELSNLIVGQLKTTYSSNNKETKLGIPKIIIHKDTADFMVKYFKVKDTYIMLACQERLLNGRS